MIISGAIIQKRNIEVSNETDFMATYKGRKITITTSHGHGLPKYDHLKRFSIEVYDEKSGMYDMEDYDDFHDIKDAIRHALKGSCLIS